MFTGDLEGTMMLVLGSVSKMSVSKMYMNGDYLPLDVCVFT